MTLRELIIKSIECNPYCAQYYLKLINELIKFEKIELLNGTMMTEKMLSDVARDYATKYHSVLPYISEVPVSPSLLEALRDPHNRRNIKYFKDGTWAP